MRILLDTNIVIHREASRIINTDIGQLFNWLNKLKYDKVIHPLTLKELEKHKDPKVVSSMKIKAASYSVLKTIAPIDERIQNIIDNEDLSENDVIDSKILNELLAKRVDYLITEDKRITQKAKKLKIENRVYQIESFLLKLINENPSLVNYKVLSVSKEYFGDININDEFFDTFKEDYAEFGKWFNKKSDNVAYVAKYNDSVCAFLYVKVETAKELYRNIVPTLKPLKRLKIGTLKVTLNGLKIGERLIKIAIDNAKQFEVQEIYVTIFNKRPGQLMLINLLEQFGFEYHGLKTTENGKERVYVKKFENQPHLDDPRKNYPFIDRNKKVHFVSIYPEYHTELFPDSILNTESTKDFIENEPHRNSIRKVYICHSINRNVGKGDALVFYRTGGYYKGVVTTVCVVDKVYNKIQSLDELKEICRRRTVLSNEELEEFWNRFPKLKPFVVSLLHVHSFRKRPNLKKIIELGIIESVDKMPRGISAISWSDLQKIHKASL